MTTEVLHRLIYTSTASDGLTANNVRDILAAAQRNNAAQAVTGALLFQDRRFIQVLEGAAPIIDGLIAVIRQDPRHHTIKILSRDPLDKRDFGDWSMAYLGDQMALQDLTGLDSFDGITNKLSDDTFVRAFIEGCQQQIMAA